MMEGGDVWEEIAYEEAWRLTGKLPMKGRWGYCNTGTGANMFARCIWVAKEVAYRHSDQVFAATPPLEALRCLRPEAATWSPPAGVSRRGGPHTII